MRKTKTTLMILLFSAPGFAQTQWTKHPSNPVMTKGGSVYEAAAVGQPAVILDNDTFKMWYVAAQDTNNARISYAFSDDGITWTKYNSATPVLDIGTPGSWDDAWLDAPEIVKDAEGYKLYYYGDTAQQAPEISSAYGAATSTDGVNWTRYPGNPVFEKADSVEWDGKWVESPALYYNPADSSYMMWYTGMTWFWLAGNGLATSENGFDWTRYPVNPVTFPGDSGSFDDMWVAVPAIIRTGRIFEMWYCGFPSDGGFDSVQTGYAVSQDGVNWLKYTGNPVFSKYYPPYDSAQDHGSPWAPDVVYNKASGEYMMWYESAGGIQLATSPRNILFSPNCNITVSNDTAIYTGDSAVLTAAGGTLYHWYPETGLSNPRFPNPKASPDTSSTYYSLAVGDSCVNLDSVTVSLMPVSSKNFSSGNNPGVKIFPNPFSESPRIQIKNKSGNTMFKLFHASGSLTRMYENITDDFMLYRKDLPAGLYYYMLMTEAEIINMGKLVVN